MENLEITAIDKVSGGYMRLDARITNVDVFSNLNDNLLKGGILHTAPTTTVRKEKIFPASRALLD